MSTDAVPDPDLVYDAYTSTYSTQLFRIALRLDLFSPLAAGPADAATVAAACGCDAAGAQALLDHLCGLHLVDRRGGRYELTSTARTFLVPGAPAYAGDAVLRETDPTTWEAMFEAFRSGRPSHHAEDFVQDAWLESYSRTRPARSMEMWRTAGLAPGQSPGRRVLDIACGCAVKSLVLAQADAGVHVTGVDRAEVLEVARDLADRLGVGARATFLAGDVLVDSFGECTHDAALIGQLCYYLTPAQNEDLFRRVHAALVPRGVLVIDVAMGGDGASQYAAMATALLWAISGGWAHPFEAYRQWLLSAGFTAVTRLGERWLSAVV